VFPDFIIIGGQRCGTTSLHRALERHPCIMPAGAKEIHFFDIHYGKGASWYRGFFPCAFYMTIMSRLKGCAVATGEASPYYFFHPLVPKRIHETVPDLKLILMLRNPVDRAYSQYHHEVRLGFEGQTSFAEALVREDERLHGEEEKILADEDYISFSHIHHAYRSRGLYLDQFKRWKAYFPSERMLVLKSEDFYEDTPKVYKQVLTFLNLPETETGRHESQNRAQNPPMDSKIRQELTDFFRPHNERLYEYLGRDFGWNP
jgi:hypothetical protein